MEERGGDVDFPGVGAVFRTVCREGICYVGSCCFEDGGVAVIDVDGAAC
jgi:hypothetical protein